MIAAYIILGAFGLFFALLAWEKRPQSSRPPEVGLSPPAS